MRIRRTGRELALRCLFQVDVGRMSPEEALEFSSASGHYAPESFGFARELLFGALEQRPHIDTVIERYARGWTLARMANVDRNVLRVAVFELLYRPDIPPSVSVDEAVEMAKKYSTAESGKFVNGILGSLIRSLHEELAEARQA